MVTFFGKFLSTLLCTLGASLLGNLLAGKGISKAGERIVRAGYGNKKGQKATRKGHKIKWIFNTIASFN